MLCTHTVHVVPILLLLHLVIFMYFWEEIFYKMSELHIQVMLTIIASHSRFDKLTGMQHHSVVPSC